MCGSPLAVCLVSLFVSVCRSCVCVVIICLASTHTALVSSPSLTVLHLTTYIQEPAGSSCQEGTRAKVGVSEGPRASTPRLGILAAVVSRALRGGRGKEEPLSAIAAVLQAAPGDDGLPPPGPPRYTSAA